VSDSAETESVSSLRDSGRFSGVPGLPSWASIARPYGAGVWTHGGNASEQFRILHHVVALLTIELRIEHAQSLKDKRQVVRSLKDRLRAHFNVATAELDASGLWNRATIGVVSVSDSRDYLEGLMKNVEREAMKIANNAGAEVVDSWVECL
jgi:uncharacterized protein YlxP (DUF503 family)